VRVTPRVAAWCAIGAAWLGITVGVTLWGRARLLDGEELSVQDNASRRLQASGPFRVAHTGSLDVTVTATLPEDSWLGAELELLRLQRDAPPIPLPGRAPLLLSRNARYGFGEYWTEEPAQTTSFAYVPAGTYELRIAPDALRSPAPSEAPRLRVTATNRWTNGTTMAASALALGLLLVADRRFASGRRPLPTETSC
jgi:hypothetical protein